MITHIIHGGQTGVDRGAHEAALDLGLKPCGTCPADCRDEFGLIPDAVRHHLRPLEFGDKAARTRANIVDADAVLVVVKNRLRPDVTPGTAYTLQHAHSRGRPILITDGYPGEEDIVAGWLARCWPRSPAKLMVAGPRETLWPEGREVTRGFVYRLLHVQP